MARPRKNRNDAPGIGDNSDASKELTDTELQSLFFHHRRQYKAALDKKKMVDADFKNTCKQARADLGKRTIDLIKLSFELDSPEGEAVFKMRIEQEMRVARWLGLALGTQGELFEAVDRRPAEEKFYAEGRRHGLAGDPCAPRAASGTATYQDYMRGFSDGQAILAQGIKKPAPTPLEQAAP